MIKPLTPPTVAQSSDCSHNRVRTCQKRLAGPRNYQVFPPAAGNVAPSPSPVIGTTPARPESPMMFHQDRQHEWSPFAGALTFDVPSSLQAVAIPHQQSPELAPPPGFDVTDRGHQASVTPGASNISEPIVTNSPTPPSPESLMMSHQDRQREWSPLSGAAAFDVQSPLHAAAIPIPNSPGLPSPLGSVRSDRGNPVPAETGTSSISSAGDPVLVTGYKRPQYLPPPFAVSASDRSPPLPPVDISSGQSPMPTPTLVSKKPDRGHIHRPKPEAVYSRVAGEPVRDRSAGQTIQLVASAESGVTRGTHKIAEISPAAPPELENSTSAVAGQPSGFSTGLDLSAPAKQVLAAALSLSGNILHSDPVLYRPASASRTLRLTLNPAGLGSVELSLRLKGTELWVTLRADHHETEQALIDDKTILELGITANETGLSLCRVEVARQDTPVAPMGNEHRQTSAGVANWSFGQAGAGSRGDGQRNTAAQLQIAENLAGGTGAEEVVGDVDYLRDMHGRVV